MKISIILPTYNRAKLFLSRAINSVINQSYHNWELIVIDNSSIDNTKELVNSYQNSKIHFFSIENKGNIAKSRNLGISQAKGDFIAFLDSDDYWKLDKLEKCINILKSNRSYDGVCHAEFWVNPKNHQEIKKYGPKKYFNYEKLLIRGNSVSLSAMVVNKKKILEAKSFSEDQNIITAEDYDLWIKLAANNINVAFIDKPLGYYQIHHNSESSDISRNTKAIIYVIKSHLKDNRQLLKIALANCWKTAGKQFYLNYSNYEAYKSYLKSIRYNYMNLKVYLLLLTTLIPSRIYKYLIEKKNI